jgi:hypothetical protein
VAFYAMGANLLRGDATTAAAVARVSATSYRTGFTLRDTLKLFFQIVKGTFVFVFVFHSNVTLLFSKQPKLF